VAKSRTKTAGGRTANKGGKWDICLTAPHFMKIIIKKIKRLKKIKPPGFKKPKDKYNHIWKKIKCGLKNNSKQDCWGKIQWTLGIICFQVFNLLK